MWLGAVRDVAIVLLALESVVIGVLLALMLAQIRKLVRLLREEVKPILDSANETAHTVQGTAHFVSDSVIDPVIKARSYAAGTMEVVRNLFFVGRQLKKRPTTPSPERTWDIEDETAQTES